MYITTNLFSTSNVYLLLLTYRVMKDFLNSVLSMSLFIVAVCLFYVSATVTFTSSLMNIIIFVIAIFVLLQGCGNIDKAHKFGKYAAEPETNTDAQPGPQHNHDHNERPREHPQRLQTDNN